ncbi:VanZ family protein [Chitinophaga tropicalis]|uniref:VanZ-like domain-containing protein n=1 Tax=Chitinophaga tropicalis TaxID=2683588 RepID=A0A7K1UBP7_9BACT|nr:VanZ family protein [Chitinophaga tropicalis]MVT11726.1 hypothetical protein [Chitinophaga tropicalis]
MRLEKRKVIFALVVYLLALIYVVFLEPSRTGGEHYSAPRWIPLKGTYEMMIEAGSSRYYWSLFLLNLFGNILLFMPLGFLGGALSGFPANKFRIVVIAFLLSLSIELLQLTLKIGVYDSDDVLLNVLGAYLGLCLFHRFVAKNIIDTYKNS